MIAAGLLTAWLASEIDLLTSTRTTLVELLGVGMFLPLGAAVLSAFWLIAGAHSLSRPVLRRIGGGALWLVFSLGIAGAFRPGWDLGDVSLASVTLGGDVGNALASPLGVLGLIALGLAGSLLITPAATMRGLRAAIAIGAASARVVRTHIQTSVAALLDRFLRRQPLPDPWIAETHTNDIPARNTAAPRVQNSTIGSVPDVSAEAVSIAAGAKHAPVASAESTPPAPAKADDTVDESEAPNRRRRSADGWSLPPMNLLKPDPPPLHHSNTERRGRVIVETLASFGVDARITQINEGPAVTQFGIEPGWAVKTKPVLARDEEGRPILDANGRPMQTEEEVSRTRVRVNKITRLTNDLALSLAAPSIRVEAPVPGEPMIGIEVPNDERRVVSMRSTIESPEFKKALPQGGVPIALGRNVTGKPVVVDLTKMPHVLIAGATGAGKSVCINSIITCILTHFSPEAVRLILVDPKRVELTDYADIPHLAFSRVVTDPDEVVGVLNVVVTEMERRYRRFQQEGARNIAAYNAVDRPEGKLPYWVVILDELADMMMAAPVAVEQQIVRLAQLARATGIHLVIATQRPSVNVVTGLIKANFPTRFAFATTSQTDSRVILDHAGAEKLLGRGDMLFVSTERLTPMRVQGTYVSDEEIRALIDFWTQDRFKEIPRPTLDHLLEDAVRSQVEQCAEEDASSDDRRTSSSRDSLFADAEVLAYDHSRISASMLQRRLRVGYPRAARLVDELEEAGIIGPADGGQSRPVLAAKEAREPV